MPQTGVLTYQARNLMCDATQLDSTSPYFDTVSPTDTPRWLLLDVQVLPKTRNLALPLLRFDVDLQDLLVLKKVNRLSVTPVEPTHWRTILQQRLGVAKKTHR